MNPSIKGEQSLERLFSSWRRAFYSPKAEDLGFRNYPFNNKVDEKCITERTLTPPSQKREVRGESFSGAGATAKRIRESPLTHPSQKILVRRVIYSPLRFLHAGGSSSEAMDRARVCVADKDLVAEAMGVALTMFTAFIQSSSEVEEMEDADVPEIQLE